MNNIVFSVNYWNYLPSKKDIATLEKLIKSNLPKDYIAHMMKFNNLDSIEDINCFPIQFNSSQIRLIKMFGKEGKGLVDEWHIIHPNPPINPHVSIPIETISDYLIKLCDEKWPSIPSKTIPIGGAGGGDQIIMDISTKNHGKIYYWVSSMEADNKPYQSPNFDNIGFIANSFTEFLQALYTCE